MYFNNLNEVLNNHWYKIFSDCLDDDLREARNNFPNTTNAKLVKEFLDVFINKDVVTVSNLLQLNNINNFLFSNEYAIINDRINLLSLFESALREDFNQWQKGFNMCLQHNKDYFDNPNYNNNFVENNKKIFEFMVEIGIESNWFDKMDVSKLVTKNLDYKNILIKKNLLTNQFFDDNIIKSYLKNPRAYDEQYISNYVSQFMPNLINVFSDYEKTKKWLLNEGISSATNVSDVAINSVFCLLLRNTNSENYFYQENFIKSWLKDDFVFKTVFTQEYSNILNDVFKNFPKLLLSSLEEKENELKYLDCSVTCIKNSVNIIQKLNIPETDLYQLCNIYFKLNEKLPNNYYSNNISNFDIIAEFYKKSKTNDTKERILSLLSKNEDSILEILDQIELDKLISSYSFLKNEQNHYPNLKLNSIFMAWDKKIENRLKIQYNVENFLYESHVNKLITIISSLEIYDTLNNINLDKTINIKIKSNHYKYDLPILFYLVQKSDDPKIISWVFNKENVNKLKTLKYNNKNIISYCLLNNLDKKLFNELVQNVNAMKTLVLENKNNLKKLKEKNNSELNTLFFHEKLNDKLNTKEEIVYKPKIKI